MLQIIFMSILWFADSRPAGFRRLLTPPCHLLIAKVSNGQPKSFYSCPALGASLDFASDRYDDIDLSPLPKISESST